MSAAPIFSGGFRPGRLSTNRSSILSVLDVGSSKICCMIARLTPRNESEVLPGRSHAIEVLGFGYQRSGGIKSGVVVDMEAAETAIRQAVDSAERSSGLTVDSLLLCVSAGRLTSGTFSSSILMDGREVENRDIRSVLAAGCDQLAEDGRMILHALPIGYGLDGQTGIRDPEGMVAMELGVDMHVVSADASPLRNLELSINRAHLSLDGIVATPYASGLASLVDDEARMGCACIDMGGGTTTISIFLNNALVFTDAIAIGGHHVTMDLARGLSTPIHDAERLKVLHGSAQILRDNDADTVNVNRVGEDGGSQQSQIPLSLVSRIIRARVEEIFEMLRDRVVRSGFAGAIGNRVVLTGGASQLTGLSGVASDLLGANIRLGRPMGLLGLPKTAKGPAFSAAAGLLIYPQMSEREFSGRSSVASRMLTAAQGGPFAKMGRWLRESF
ncbi:MAG: cell division protein FtsA [Pseudomonadota bacterium]